jgi:hypothetical protein
MAELSDSNDASNSFPAALWELPAPVSIWARIRQIWDEVPLEELLKLPTDGAEFHDRCIRELNE